MTVQYFASVRELINLREERLEVPDGTDVKRLLNLLVARHGDSLKKYLYNEDGNPRPHLQFLLDREPISKTGGFSAVMKNGSVLAIIPPVGGG